MYWQEQCLSTSRQSSSSPPLTPSMTSSKSRSSTVSDVTDDDRSYRSQNVYRSRPSYLCLQTNYTTDTLHKQQHTSEFVEGHKLRHEAFSLDVKDQAVHEPLAESDIDLFNQYACISHGSLTRSRYTSPLNDSDAFYSDFYLEPDMHESRHADSLYLRWAFIRDSAIAPIGNCCNLLSITGSLTCADAGCVPSPAISPHMGIEANASTEQVSGPSLPTYSNSIDSFDLAVDQTRTLQSSTSTSLPIKLPREAIYNTFRFQKPTSKDADTHVKPCWNLARPIQIQETSREIELRVRAIRQQSSASPVDEYHSLPFREMREKIDELLSTYRNGSPNCEWSIAAIETERRKVSDRATGIGSMLVTIMGQQKHLLSIEGQVSPASGQSSQDFKMSTLVPPLNSMTQSSRGSPGRMTDTHSEAVPNDSQSSKSPIPILRPYSMTTSNAFPSPAPDFERFQEQVDALLPDGTQSRPTIPFLKLNDGTEQFGAKSLLYASFSFQPPCYWQRSIPEIRLCLLTCGIRSSWESKNQCTNISNRATSHLSRLCDPTFAGPRGDVKHTEMPHNELLALPHIGMEPQEWLSPLSLAGSDVDSKSWFSPSSSVDLHDECPTAPAQRAVTAPNIIGGNTGSNFSILPSVDYSVVQEKTDFCEKHARDTKEYDQVLSMKRGSTASAIEPQDSFLLSSGKKQSSNKRRVFHCTYCDVQYSSKAAWTRHETEFHESSKKWQCPDCKATFLNESNFTRHHKQNHSCHRCNHANEAKIELPRKTAWGCGFCGEMWKDWKGRCEHVASHFAAGKTKNDWDFSNVIVGLLKQKWIATAWEALIAERHGTNIESRPSFQWQSKNEVCLEVMQDLQHGHCDNKAAPHESLTEERLRELVETAYRLGITTSPPQQMSTPLFPNDSESM